MWNHTPGLAERATSGIPIREMKSTMVVENPRPLKVVPTIDGRFRRYKIVSGNGAVVCYNPASEQPTHLDFLLKRPSLHPLYTPSGVPVTEQGAHNYLHHKAVWIALGRVNDVNMYHDYHGRGGRITTRDLTWEESEAALVLTAAIEWIDEEGSVLVEEERIHRVYASEQVNRIDIDSRLTTPVEGGVELPKEKHGFFHCRVIDAIDEEDGGSVRASNGVQGADSIFDTDGYWIDTRGNVGANSVGVTIMVHPDFGPQPLFARSYGTVALNPFLREGRWLHKGETYRNVYSVWAYDQSDAFDPEQAFQVFARTAIV